jgi:hypothetical protein
MGKYTAFDMWFAFADDWLHRQDVAPGRWVILSWMALLFLDQIKREKGVWWMPWQ